MYKSRGITNEKMMGGVPQRWRTREPINLHVLTGGHEAGTFRTRTQGQKKGRVEPKRDGRRKDE